MTAHVAAPAAQPAACRPPATDVEVWRLRRLVEAGFALPLALRLAVTPGVDPHALLALVDRGCPPHLAARILSPIELPFDEAEGRL
jgi:hypothetical protein